MKLIAIRAVLAGFLLVCLATPLPQGASSARIQFAFSTLGTPAWTLDEIISRARQWGYRGLELRGLLDQVDVRRRPEFRPESIASTRRRIERAGLKVCSLGSSAKFHMADPVERARNLEEAIQYVDLAVALGCPNVRVFGDIYPKGEDRGAVVERLAAGLKEAGRYARARNVRVLLETHGEFTDSKTLKTILDLAAEPAVGLVWDAHHTVVGGESPAQTLDALFPFVRHVHLKDSVAADKGRRYVLTGRGDIPIAGVLDELERRGYRGFVSFEWETRWHPEIEDPAVAIPQFIQFVRKPGRR